MTKAKILILTHSVALPSGMAETTRLIFETLLARYPDAYEVEQIGLVHSFAVSVPKWPIHPTRTVRRTNGELDLDQADAHGEKTLPEVVRRFRPDLVFAFNDPQNVAFLCVPRESRPYKLVLHVNFDGYPFPSADASVFRNADLIVTCSSFSRKVLITACPLLEGKTEYMYSPADIERFKPISDEEKKGLRGDLLPRWMPQDAFLLGFVGRNQWRKQIWLLYAVLHYLRSGKYWICQQCARITLIDWHPGLQCHRDEVPAGGGRDLQMKCQHCWSDQVTCAEPLSDIFLWLHLLDKKGEGDWPLTEIEYQFNVKRARDLHYTQGLGGRAALAPVDMPVLFQMWDALLYLTGGEGFGLPAWEAICTGLPVVYTDYSSHAEFLRLANGGLPVSGILQPEARSGVWRMIADVPQALEAVRRLYFDRELGPQMGANGRAFVQDFKPAVQADKWHEMLRRVLHD
ncbi:hypothetical protein SBV1_370116 [Verrucomicrobia bacterium]|nr:hypothetical protein SBV1_370116 [Verrucomicrobiota bacterium]